MKTLIPFAPTSLMDRGRDRKIRQPNKPERVRQIIQQGFRAQPMVGLSATAEQFRMKISGPTIRNVRLVDRQAQQAAHISRRGIFTVGEISWKNERK